MGTLPQSMTLQQLLSLVVSVFVQIGRRVQAICPCVFLQHIVMTDEM